jgi:protein-S-isoprenylcysteine O-methyltransferase Ste14
MFARALLAFLALPGVVAFAMPWVILRSSILLHPAGLLLVGMGCAGLLWCVRDFYVMGKGTLAPWAPPRHLVECGLYRYSRNPMYVAVLLYAAVVAVAFQCRVVWGEEPWLARTHGARWEAYRARVPRWILFL